MADLVVSAVWVAEDLVVEVASTGVVPAGSPRDGDNVGAAGGGPDPEREGVRAAAFAAADLANLGPLRSSDFKISSGAAAVCEEVSNFTAPPCVSELFKKWSTQRMFRSLEANTMKVSSGKRAPPLLTES